MTEFEFQTLADSVLADIEDAVGVVADKTDLDIESSRRGNVLEIECMDSGAKIIINSQSSMQEIWVAARSGGFHYRYESGQWIDTRDGSELFTAVSRIASALMGAEFILRARK